MGKGSTAAIVCIYALTDEDGSIRYIGKANDPAKRLKAHMAEAGRLSRPVNLRIRKRGKPGMVILEQNPEDWMQAERNWIALARRLGVALLNVADGGDMPHCDKATRQRNGRNVAKSRDPIIWAFNRDCAKAHRHKQLPEKMYPLLRELAALRPDPYGMWKGVALP